MIFYRTSGSDSNPAGSSGFCGIPQPIGVRDGDIVIVGISLPTSGVVVTPPDSSWTKVLQTDPSITLGIIIFWKVALNEPANWVFSVNGSMPLTGGVIVYGNTDPFSPIEAFAPALSAASFTIPIAAISPSIGGEELVLFAASASSLGIIGATDYIQTVSKTQAGGLSYGTSGTGGTPHIAGELLKMRTGANLVHVPYKGGGQAITDVLGGSIPLVYTAIAGANQHVRSGKLVGLGVSSGQRSTSLPDVPTFIERDLARYGQVVKAAGIKAE